MSKTLLKKSRMAELILLGCTVFGFLVAPFLFGQQDRPKSVDDSSKKRVTGTKSKLGDKKLDVANFGAGCFWCVEAVFQELKGVASVESGYMGGAVANPTYEQVCTGTTGHAEICQIKFDPKVISFKELLEVFWKTHDPTTLNRQGADRGTQYRSAVFYTSQEQREQAEKYKKLLDDSGAFPNPIVTEVSEATAFYSAGDYHANYFKLNPNAGYCQFVIQPKVDKFKRVFADKLKSAK